jgi:thiol:disulfide interchange protein
MLAVRVGQIFVATVYLRAGPDPAISPRLIIFSFIGFGLLLALTPCVFPMIPILSGLAIGSIDSNKNGIVIFGRLF